jgi:methylated-DNA-[protein]-cysteine S-methyltransferase
MKAFKQKVLDVVASIPAGEILSYSEVASRAGSPGAARAVGSILKKNYDPDIPCHRVILKSGVAGQYNRGGSEKIRKLKKEGISFDK